MSSGKIVQVIGPVVDVEFSLDQSLPDINNALVVYKNGEARGISPFVISGVAHQCKTLVFTLVTKAKVYH